MRRSRSIDSLRQTAVYICALMYVCVSPCVWLGGAIFERTDSCQSTGDVRTFRTVLLLREHFSDYSQINGKP